MDLVNPTSGTNDVVINFSTSVGGYAWAVSYTGTDTSNPIGATNTNSGGSGDPSVSITTTNNYSIIDDHVFYDQGQQVNANSPQVQPISQTCTGNNYHGASTLQTTTPGAKRSAGPAQATTVTGLRLQLKLRLYIRQLQVLQAIEPLRHTHTILVITWRRRPMLRAMSAASRTTALVAASPRRICMSRR